MGQSPSIEQPAFTPEDAIKMSQIVRKNKLGSSTSRDLTPQKSFIKDTSFYEEEDSYQYNPSREVNKAINFVQDFLIISSVTKPNDVNLDANPILVVDSNMLTAPEELEESQIFSKSRQSLTPRGYAVKLRMKGIISRTQQYALKTNTVFKELGADKYKRFSFASHKLESKAAQSVDSSNARISRRFNDFDDLPAGLKKETRELYNPNSRLPQQESNRNQSSEERMPQFGDNSKYRDLNSHRTLDEHRREKKEKDNKNHESLVNLREEMDKFKESYERNKSIERKSSARNVIIDAEFMSPRNYETPKAGKKVKFEEEEREIHRTPMQISQAYPRYDKQNSNENINQNQNQNLNQNQNQNHNHGFVNRESVEFPPQELVISHNQSANKRSKSPYQHILRVTPQQEESMIMASRNPYQPLLRSTPQQDESMISRTPTERTARPKQPVITDYLTKKNEIRGHSPQEVNNTSRSRSPGPNQPPNAIPHAKEPALISAHNSMLPSNQNSFYFDPNDSYHKPLDSRFISPRSQVQQKIALQASPQSSVPANYSGQRAPNQYYPPPNQHYPNPNSNPNMIHQQGYQNYSPSQPVLIKNNYNNYPNLKNNNPSNPSRLATPGPYREERPKNAGYDYQNLNRSVQDYSHPDLYEEEFSSPVSINLNLQDLLNDSRANGYSQPMQNERPKQQPQPPQQNMYQQASVNRPKQQQQPPQQNVYQQPSVNRHNQVDHLYNAPNQGENGRTVSPSPQYVQKVQKEPNVQYYLPSGMASNVKPRQMGQGQQQFYGHPNMQNSMQMQERGGQNQVSYYLPQQQYLQQQEKLNKSAMLDNSESRKEKNYEVRYVKNPIFQGSQKNPSQQQREYPEMSQSVIVSNLEFQHMPMQQQPNESMMKRSKWEMRNDAGYISARNQILPPEFTNSANGYHSARRQFSCRNNIEKI